MQQYKSFIQSYNKPNPKIIEDHGILNMERLWKFDLVFEC